MNEEDLKKREANTILLFYWINLIRCEVSLAGRVQDKVDNPYSVTFLIRTPVIEWYVVWCGTKNGYQKGMCLKEVGLHAQKYDNHSMFNRQHK